MKAVSFIKNKGVWIREATMGLGNDVQRLKEEKNAVVLVHNYQLPEIQDIADFLGDSLGLARKAVETDADAIVFCGVDFMAETAKILNPEKTVLMPEPRAACPMAAMLKDEDLAAAKEEHPDSDVVLYVNTRASSKAHADCVCTSGNCVDVINAMQAEEVVFAPDANLAHYVGERTDKNVICVPAEGHCYTHNRITVASIREALKKHPDAKVVVHPECRPGVQKLADEIASTEGILTYCRESSAEEFIIGTENGMLYRMQKEIPEKRFYPACDTAICDSMKFTTLDKVKHVLETGDNEIIIPNDIAEKAKKPIERMLALR